MRNGPREMMQCLCDIKAYINAQYFLSRTEINFYLTPERNTLFVRAYYHYKSTMSVSETNTPASTATSITATEEKNAPTLAEVVRKYKTKELIDFLCKEEDLELSETAIKILEKEEITGRAFLKITKEELRSYGMPGGPASDLADFAKELGKRKLKSFSSYKTLKELGEVLEKYGIVSGDITRIPQFIPRK
jgi:hypothetical protein